MLFVNDIYHQVDESLGYAITTTDANLMRKVATYYVSGLDVACHFRLTSAQVWYWAWKIATCIHANKYVQYEAWIKNVIRQKLLHR